MCLASCNLTGVLNAPTPVARNQWRYRHCGITIESALELSEWAAFAAPRTGEPDARIIVSGECFPPLPAESFARIEEGVGFAVTGVGSWAIRSGEEIAIAPASAADPASLSLFTRGSAFFALGLKRGWTLLHGSAVTLPEVNGAVLLCGPSGAGKSTLAAELVEADGTLVGDDLSRVELSGGGASIHPSASEMRLWRDAVERLGWQDTVIAPDPWRPDKLRCVAPRHAAQLGAMPIAAVVVLDEGEAGSERFDGLSGGAAVQAILAATAYRPQLVELLGAEAQQARSAMQLAKAVPVFSFVREGDERDAGRELARRLVQILT